MMAPGGFEQYLKESTVDGSIPLRFECSATPNLSVEEVADAF